MYMSYGWCFSCNAYRDIRDVIVMGARAQSGRGTRHPLRRKSRSCNRIAEFYIVLHYAF